MNVPDIGKNNRILGNEITLIDFVLAYSMWQA